MKKEQWHALNKHPIVREVGSCGVKTQSKEPQRVSNVRFYHKNLKFFFLGAIWCHGNHGTLFIFNTHECQETQTKTPFDPILSFGLVKDFWKWKKKLLEKDIFTKDFQRTHIIEISWW